MIKIFLVSILFLAALTTSVSALDITFPIAQLGNCNNVQTCKVYCDQPENHDTCKQFAKSKGLYKDQVDERQVELLSLAKQELGCETILSCRDLCSKEANYPKCQSFAKKHSLAQTRSEDEELLTKAKQNLNCDSFESCKTLCDQQENYVKCAALLQDQITSDDRAMFEKYKPLIKEHLGCDSMVTCMAFCINPLNTPKCNEFGKIIEAEQGNTYSYDSSEPPEVWCPKVSSECSWDGTTCVCMGPETCTQSNEIEGCTWDGTQCNCPGIEGSPQEWCPKAGPGCAWDGKECTCPGSESTSGTAPTAEPGDVWCPRLGPYCVWDGSSCTCWDDCIKAGGTWTGTRCELPLESGLVTPSESSVNQPTLEPGEVWCPRNPGCKWTGETCLCEPVLVPPTPEPSPSPAVQGTSTNRSLLQQILDFVLGLL